MIAQKKKKNGIKNICIKINFDDMTCDKRYAAGNEYPPGHSWQPDILIDLNVVCTL